MLIRATLPAVKAIKNHLIEIAKAVPVKVRSGHLDESLAAGLGFGSYAALTVRLAETSPHDAVVSDDAFRRRLTDLVGTAPVLSLSEAVRRGAPDAIVGGIGAGSVTKVQTAFDNSIPVAAFMRGLDDEYRALTGLSERRDAIIAYSRLQPARAIVFGINPGGNPATWSGEIPDIETLVAQRWHDYLDSRYPLQAVMRDFLSFALDTDDAGLRDVPKSNIIFRRSPGTDAFQDLHGMTLIEAAREAAPFTRRILEQVDPRVVILEGKWCMARFRQFFCPTGYGKRLGPTITGEFRGTEQPCYIAHEMEVACLGRTLPVVALGHPTHFSRLPEWNAVKVAVRDIVRAAS